MLFGVDSQELKSAAAVMMWAITLSPKLRCAC
jgi:hypothetical protein